MLFSPCSPPFQRLACAEQQLRQSLSEMGVWDSGRAPPELAEDPGGDKLREAHAKLYRLERTNLQRHAALSQRAQAVAVKEHRRLKVDMEAKRVQRRFLRQKKVAAKAKKH